MTVKTFDELVAKVKSGKKSTVALVCANDAHALEAVIHASDLVDAVLVVEAEKKRKHGRWVRAAGSAG